MKRCLLLTYIAVLINLNLNAQLTFQKAFGGIAMDEANCIRQTFDQGYIIAGTTTSFGVGGRDVLVIKTNAQGDTVWTKTFGGDIDNEYGFYVQQTNDSGYIVSGTTSSFNDVAGDMYVIKLNNAGDTLWTRTYGGLGYEWGSAIQQTLDFGYIIVGQTPAFGAGGFDAYLVKIDSSGNLAWTKTYGGAGLEIGSAVQQTTDGGYILTGQIDSYGAGGGDFYLLKTDVNGNVLWTKAYGTAGTETGLALQQTTDGGYIIGGTSEDALGPLGPDMCLIKTDSIGNVLWSYLYGGPMIDECYDVIQTNDGGFIMCGKSFSFSNAGDYDVYIVKTNQLGIIQWSKTYGNASTASSNDIGYSIEQTIDGGYIIGGESLFGFGVGLKNAYIIKTDSLGNSGCNQGIPGTIATVFAPQTVAPPTLISFGGIVTRPATLVGAGSISTNICFSTAVEENFPTSKVRVFPNPFSSTLTVEFDEIKEKNVTFRIIDNAGRLLKEWTAVEQMDKGGCVQLDLSSLSIGVYFLSLNGNVPYEKIVKID